MSTLNSVPYLPETWAIELPEEFGKRDVESLFQNILQTLSECISARSSDSISPSPYVTGATLTTQTQSRQLIQLYISWLIPSGGGSTSVAIPEQSKAIPVEIYGTATIETPTVTSYPLGYNVDTTSISAYFSNNNVNITASSALAGYTANVVVRYVYSVS